MLIRHISLKIILKIKLVYEIFVLKKSFLPKTFFFFCIGYIIMIIYR